MRVSSFLARGATLALAASMLALAPKAARAEGFLGFVLRPDTQGAAVVRAVVPGSAAEAADVRAGDTLVRLDSAPVTASSAALRIAAATSNLAMRLEFQRAGATRSMLLVPQRRPDAEPLLRSLLLGRFAPPLGTADATNTARGQVRVLYFWSSHCPPCRSGMQAMSALAARFGVRGLRVFGPTYEPEARARTRALDWGGQFDIVPLSGDDYAHSEYLITAYPTTIIVDRNNLVRNVWVGSAPANSLEQAIETWLNDAPTNVTRAAAPATISISATGTAFGHLTQGARR